VESGSQEYVADVFPVAVVEKVEKVENVEQVVAVAVFSCPINLAPVPTRKSGKWKKNVCGHRGKRASSGKSGNLKPATVPHRLTAYNNISIVSFRPKGGQAMNEPKRPEFVGRAVVEQVEVDGKVFISRYRAALYYGISPGKMVARLNRGWTLEQALELAAPPPRKWAKPIATPGRVLRQTTPALARPRLLAPA
jgi:hypothetical protein